MSNSPGSAASRIQAQQRAMAGKDVVCEQCGSTYFYEVQTTLFLAGGSGSVEILMDANAQMFPLLKCAGCNFPVLPKPATGRRHGGVFESAHKEFRASIEKGQEYLKSRDPETIQKELLTVVAPKGVEGHVEDLRERMNTLEAALGAPAHAAENAKPEPK